MNPPHTGRDTRGSVLDDLEAIRSRDRRGMLGLVEAFPGQCRDAARIASQFTPAPGSFANVVILGMGGSAIGGDLLRVLLEAEGVSVPIIVCRDYRCPAFVNDQTLCIAASYSGNTEETLSAARDALNRGAALLPVTTGGELAALAREREIPAVTIPGGQPPRSALGYLFLPSLMALSRLGICRDFAPEIDDMHKVLNRIAGECAVDVPTAGNEAKRIALALHRSLPVFYGSSPVTGVVAFRWKCQFNENAKMQAFWNNLPELDHNEICGWRSAARQGRIRWVFLRDRGDPPHLRQRVEVTRSILAASTTGHTDIWGRGESLLSRLMSGILLGDFASTYAAILNNIDPTDIREIDVLKDELAAQSVS